MKPKLVDACYSHVTAQAAVVTKTKGTSSAYVTESGGSGLLARLN